MYLFDNSIINKKSWQNLKKTENFNLHFMHQNINGLN